MNLSYGLRTLARHSAALPALTCEGTTLSYGAFDDQAARIGGALRAGTACSPASASASPWRTAPKSCRSSTAPGAPA